MEAFTYDPETLGRWRGIRQSNVNPKKMKKIGVEPNKSDTPSDILVFVFELYHRWNCFFFMGNSFFSAFLTAFYTSMIYMGGSTRIFLNEFTEKYCEILPSFSPFLRSPEILRSKMEQTLRLSGHVMQGNGMGWSKFSAKNFFRSHFERTKWKAPENKPSQRKVVFQPSIFRCYLSFREGNHSSLVHLSHEKETRTFHWILVG